MIRARSRASALALSWKARIDCNAARPPWLRAQVRAERRADRDDTMPTSARVSHPASAYSLRWRRMTLCSRWRNTTNITRNTANTGIWKAK